MLRSLDSCGHLTVDSDTDTDEWSEWITLPDGSSDWIWREARHRRVACGAERARESLFLAGCKSNQGNFYPLFDHIVLLSAPADVLLAGSPGGTTTRKANVPKNELQFSIT